MRPAPTTSDCLPNRPARPGGNPRRMVFALLLLGMAASPAVLKEADPSRDGRPGPKAEAEWTVDDVVMAEEASDFRISPDSRWVAWVKSVPDRDRDERVGRLMLSSLTEDREVQLTREENSLGPRWSPDGRLIAFSRSSSRGKGDSAEDDSSSEVWLINPFGGEPWRLSPRGRSISAYEWAGPDSLVVSASEEEAADEKAAREKDDSIVVDAARPPVRLYRLSAATGEMTKLTENQGSIDFFAVSPDGRHAVTFNERSPLFEYDNRVKPVYFLCDLKSGERRPIFTDRKFNLTQVQWAPDGKGFYAVNEFTTDPRYVMATVTELSYYDLGSGSASRIDLGWEKGLSYQRENETLPGVRVGGDGFVALLANGARNEAARYVRQGSTWRRARLTGEHAEHLFGFDLGRDGRALVYACSAAGVPTQWYRARLSGERIESPVPLTHLNEPLRKKPIARTELVRWKGALEEEVEGVLYYPHRYREGERYPLVVLLHGGPDLAEFDAWTDSWSHPLNLLAGRGAFVLEPNYHGSSNYGLGWAESLKGKYFELELPDIEKGVDSLVGRGLVDPQRLGVMGWSNGAILVAALTVHTTRYRAASVMAGTVEQASDWGYTKYGAAFDEHYLGKTPFEDPALYVRKSPFYRMDRVCTPTLIFTGADDKVVGPQQGWCHYHALRETGRTPVRFLVFPGEEHSLEKLSHQRRKVREELDWFDRYLFAEAKGDGARSRPGPPAPGEKSAPSPPVKGGSCRPRRRRGG